MSRVRPSRQPYFLRAMKDWLDDSGLTAQIVVNASFPGAQVPEAYVKEGKIVLNISSGAVRGLVIDNDAVSFSARFSGTPYEISVPMGAVLGIYARETGEGLAFDPDAQPGPPGGNGEDKPHLRVVK